MEAPTGRTADKLKEIIEEWLGLRNDDIGWDKSIKDDFGADSLDDVELIMACEEEFGIEIPDDDAEEAKTPRQAYELIKKIKGGA